MTSSALLSPASKRRSARQPKPHCSTTKEAYARDVRRFTETYGFSVPCTADELIAFIRILVKRVAPATAYRRCMAIQAAHLELGVASPTEDPRVREALRWLAARQLPQNLLDGKHKTTKAGAPKKCAPRQAKPITRSMLLRIFDAMGTGRRSIDLRDKALMLLGFAGLKRGEMLALDIEHCRFTEDALLLRVTAVTGDKGADESVVSKGRIKALPRTRGPMCAALAVEAWLDCWRRSKFDPPCRLNFDPGLGADIG
ncbi:hypothetical protein [Roseateles flavus]|uniref:Tyr recombinase domain-containing protein n=1 Tax=Roseateles flavus TaxID=3149041 RepID=A0ABV0GLF5_9BURK